MAAIYLAASLLICKAIIDSLPVGIEKARTVAGEIRKAKNEQAQRAAAEAAEQDRQQQLEKNVPPKSCWMTWMEHAQAVPPSDY
jgi:ribosomal protein L22